MRVALRALHRDIGYFSVGLTVIYAASGLAVNHIADWGPNFTQVTRTHQLCLPLASVGPADTLSPEQRDQALAREILAQLAIGLNGVITVVLTIIVATVALRTLFKVFMAGGSR